MAFILPMFPHPGICAHFKELTFDQRSKCLHIRIEFAVLFSLMLGLCACDGANNPVSNDRQLIESDQIVRGADGRPKLDGIWQSLAGANWDIRAHAAASPVLDELGALGAAPPGLGIIEDNEIPYQSWAAEQQSENFANRLSLDPEVKCYLPGVPRANYMDQPFQIFQTTDFVMITYQYAGAVRTIHMNDPGPSPADSWMGWSIGHWEGDTLVVEVTGQNDQTWFDRAGNFHSNALHVVERYTMMSPNHLIYEAEIEDPEVFTRSWKISLPLYRRVEETVQLMNFKCVEFAEEILYGDLRKQPVE